MATRRAKKHRQVVKQQQTQKTQQRTKASITARQGYIVEDELRKQITRANSRLRRLEQAGLINEIYTLTTNTLGKPRFTIPKSAEEFRKTKLILNKFLGAKTSTVKTARTVSTKNKKDFAEFLKRANQGKLSDSAINVVSARMGDLDLSELIKSYIYNEIIDAVVELENSGIEATSNNVNRALSADIDSVIEDDLARRGVDVPPEIMGIAVSVARENGIDDAIDFIEQWIAESGV